MNINLSRRLLRLTIICLSILLVLCIFIDVNSNSRFGLPSGDWNFGKQSADIFDMEEAEYLFHRLATDEFSVDNMTGNNINGFPKTIVPNIVHYVLLSNHILSFVHFISIKSVLRNQKPDQIMIHCDCDKVEGRYWDWLMKENWGKTKLVIHRIKFPAAVFGQKFSPEYHSWHASDVARIKILMEFGGIYLDRDMYIVKSLDEFRRFEMTVSQEWMKWKMANNIMIGHRNARFLKLYLSLYQDYRPKWEYNSLEQPMKLIQRYPHLVRLMTNNEFGTHWTCPLLHVLNSKTWQKDFFSFHLWMRGDNIDYHGQWCYFNKIGPVTWRFNETSVKKLNTTFGQMARLLLYNTTDLIQ